MKPGEFYRVPKQIASEYPVVEGTRCVSVHIPDDDSYLAVLAAAHALLSNTWSSVGTVEERRAWSRMWMDAYAATDWDACMNCEDVADCIETNTDVQDAINNVYNNYGTGVPMPPSISGRNLLPELVDCNRDELWGAVSALVDGMHQNNVDAFEVIEVATNIAERGALLFSAIPVLETLPVNEAVDYLQTIWTDDLFEAYNANDTTEYRDTLKCDLFCIAVGNNCSLSIDDVYAYFLSRIGGDFSDNFVELIAYLVTGTWVGTEVNDMFFTGQLLVMYYGNQFFEMIGIYTFEMYLELGKRDPSDAWEVLCTECGADYCFVWDMSLGLQGWQIQDGFGAVVTGGIDSDDTPLIWLYRDDWDGVKIKYVRITVTQNTMGLQLGVPNPAMTTFVQFTGVPSFDPEHDVTENTGFQTVDSLAVRATIDGLTVPTGIITEIEVCYFGQELPFGE